MKYFIALICFITLALACTGDCTKCHPVLKKSIEKEHHKILKTCINCHTKSSPSMNECGGDCFSCHKKEKLINSNRFEHQQVASCKECHVTKEDMLNIVDQSTNLLDMLNQK